MEERNPIEASVEETCALKSFERNKYFYGKLMTVRDFETEQRYFNEKRHLLNRLIHGIGLVCGLQVSEPEMVDGKLRIKLSSGVALDCCGHEIVVENGGTFDLGGSPSEGLNYVYLKYKECVKEPVPSLANPSVCEEVCCYSRIKEDFEVEVSKAGPPAAMAFNWQEVWQNRQHNIQEVADKLEIPEPKDWIEAKLLVTLAEYLETVGCPSCDDPKVLLAVISMAGTDVEVDEEETLALRSIVYSNPMLHELLKSHLTDLDNPHRVTAEQAGALKSVDGVENPGGDVDLVKDNAITIVPDMDNKRITIGENHSAREDNPHHVTAEQAEALKSVDGVENPGGDVDLVKDNAITIVPDMDNKRITIGESHSAREDNPHHVTAEQAGALKSVDGLSNPGGDIDLVEGEGIKIEHLPISAETPPQIKISATGAAGAATTGVIQLTIPKATIAPDATSPTPGHVVRKDIYHRLDTELPPAVILGLVTGGLVTRTGITGIIMEEDFISQRELIEIVAKAYGVAAPPPVSFRALAVNKEKFDIVAVNTNPETDETILIRWWAIPAAREIVRISPGIIIDTVRAKLGDEALSAIATERSITAAEVSVVMSDMLETMSAKPSGLTSAKVAEAIGVKKETIQPVLSALLEAGILKSTGTGVSKKFILRG